MSLFCPIDAAQIVTEEHIPSSVKRVKPAGNAYPIRFFPLEKKAE